MTIGDPGPQKLFGNEYVLIFFMTSDFIHPIRNRLDVEGLNQGQAERLRDLAIGEITFRIIFVRLDLMADDIFELKPCIHLGVDSVSIKGIKNHLGNGPMRPSHHSHFSK